MARLSRPARGVTTRGDDALPLLAIEVSESGSATTVTVSGELDLSNVDELRSRIEPLLAAHPEVMTFDLENLRFIDSSGIGLLLGAASRVGSIHLRNPSEIVRQVLNYTGLNGVLAVDP